MKDFIVTLEVRMRGEVGGYVEAQSTVVGVSTADAALKHFQKEMGDSYETRGFSVHDEKTRELVLGGGMKIDRRMYEESKILKARKVRMN